MDALPPRSAWRVPQTTAKPAPASVRLLTDEGAGALPVRVVIEQNGFVTGWDEGALGFDEEAMWFSGDCSSFCVLGTDLASRWTSLEDVVRRGLVIRHPNRLVRLRFIFLAPMAERWTLQSRLAEGVYRLQSAPRRTTRGSQSEYPPLVPRPGAAVWRSRTDMLPLPGSAGPIASWLERAGLTRILASDIDFLKELRLRRRLLRDIEAEEEG